MKGNVLLSIRQRRHKIVYQALLSYNDLTINNVRENRQMTNYGLQNCIAGEVSTILYRIKLCYRAGKLFQYWQFLLCNLSIYGNYINPIEKYEIRTCEKLRMRIILKYLCQKKNLLQSEYNCKYNKINAKGQTSSRIPKSFHSFLKLYSQINLVSKAQFE